MLIALSLVLVAAAYRLLAARSDFLPNVALLMAIAFCGAAYLPRRWALAVPVGALLLSDLALNAHYGVSMLHWATWVTACCYLGAAGIGFWAAGNRTWPRLLGGAAGSSILFYLVTNTAAWLNDPGYAKTAAGLLQALTVGLPQYPPTWLFLRNSILSDLAFTVVFVLCMEWGRRTPPVPADLRADSAVLP